MSARGSEGSSRPGSKGQPASRPGSRGQPASRKASDFEGGSSANSASGSRPGSRLSSRADSKPLGSSRPTSRQASRGVPPSRGSVRFGESFPPPHEDETFPFPPDGSDKGSTQSEGEDEDQPHHVPHHAPRQRQTKLDRLLCLQSLVDDQEKYNDHAYNGLFIDFLVRHRARKLDYMNAKNMLNAEAEEGEEAVKVVYEGGPEVVKAEKLLACLQKVITDFYKGIGSKEWRGTGNEMKKHMAEVVSHKKKQLALNVEVDKWMVMRKLKFQGPKRVAEFDGERRQRLGDYWTKFHTTHKHSLIAPAFVDEVEKAVSGAVETGIARVAAGEDDGEADLVSRPVSQVFKKCKSSGPLWYAHSCGHRANTPAALVSGDAWKLRSSRSLCSRAGSRAGPRPPAIAADCKEDTPCPSVSFPSLAATSSLKPESRPNTGTSRHGSRPTSRSTEKQGLEGLPNLGWFSETPGKRPVGTWMGSRAASRAGTASLNASRSFGTLSSPTSIGDFRDWGFASSLPLASDSGKGSKPSSRGASRGGCGLSSSMPNLPSMVTPKIPKLNKKGASQVLEKKKTLMPHSNCPSGHSVKATIASCCLVKLVNSSTQRYLCACDDKHLLPSLMPFVTGHSSRLCAMGQGMSDDDLLTVVEMFKTLKTVHEVDLESNSMLTERSLVPLLKSLQKPCADRHLRILSLKNCLKIEPPYGVHKVLGVTVDLISDKVQQLVTLDLSGVPMGHKRHLQLCQAIRFHPRLKTVNLTDVRMGFDSPDVKECIEMLLKADSLESLDLGWNSFDEDIFEYLGEGLTNNETLKSLGLSNCACTAKNGASSAERFLELLGEDKSLTSLDLSLNRLDFRGALVLEASLECNPRLQYLNLSGNPLGVLGFRSIMRLLSRDSSGLLYFECADSAIGNSQQGMNEEGGQVFNSVNPGGRYELKLWRPYHRALMKKLYSAMCRFGLQVQEAFSDMSSSHGYQHPAKGPNGAYAIPMLGEVSFTFAVEAAMEKQMKEHKNSVDFATVLDAHYTLVRIQPSLRKQVPVLAQWVMTEGKTLEQLCMVEALSKDFMFTLPQFLALCRSKSMVSELAWRLLPNIKGGDPARFLGLLQMPTLGEYLRFVKRAAELLMFNVENPTGSYKLDLSNCSEFSVAEQLMLLDRWECRLAERKKLENVSQKGIRSCFRNEQYEGRQLQVNTMAEFVLREHGELKFDYVSSRKPDKHAKALDKVAFDQVLLALQQAECGPQAAVKAVKKISHFMYLSALQLRALTGIYKDSEIRGDIFVDMALRIIDQYNEKVFRARFSDQEEFTRLLNRLGHAAFFPFIQPEETTFSFDFSVWDQRLACCILINLAMSESMGNLRDYQFIRRDGTIDHLPAGVPPTWSKFENLGTSGTFTVLYTCSADDRKFPVRKEMLQKYTGYKVPSESEVMYWSSISSCHEDAVEFVEFLNSRFKDVNKSFTVIDGPDGNGEISYGEFKEGLLQTLQFKKFAGEDEDARLRNLFRFLDPGGEGTVSIGEWQVLDQLFREIHLCVKEFVQFCVRTFGNLEEAWKALDASGDGEIDEAEWLEACETLGFFGPARPIFSYLDKDDEGSVSLDEFNILEEYLDKG